MPGVLRPQAHSGPSPPPPPGQTEASPAGDPGEAHPGRWCQSGAVGEASEPASVPLAWPDQAQWTSAGAAVASSFVTLLAIMASSAAACVGADELLTCISKRACPT